jgi:hypothetical protein
MLRKLLLVASLALLPACVSPSETLTGEEGVVFRSGTSFGMCMGYCVSELTVTPDELLLVETSRDPAQATRTRRLPLGEEEWEEILALVQPSELEGLPEVLGCPDCADGGAEWIEVEHDGGKRRVTFEYGSTVEPIQPLVAKARELRERFPR